MPNEPSLAQVIPMKDFQDAREQAVIPPVTAASIAAAKRAHDEERDAFLHTYPEAERDHVKRHLEAALRGQVRPDLCSICGRPTIDHYQGAVYLGHWYAWRIADKPIPCHPVTFNDPHAYVTAVIQETLREDCGPDLTEFLATLGSDLVHQIAMQLSRVAVSAHLTEMAK